MPRGLRLIMKQAGYARFVDESGVTTEQKGSPCSDIGGVGQLERETAALAQQCGLHHDAAVGDGDPVVEDLAEDGASVVDTGPQCAARAGGAGLSERGDVEVAKRDDDGDVFAPAQSADATFEQV